MSKWLTPTSPAAPPEATEPVEPAQPSWSGPSRPQAGVEAPTLHLPCADLPLPAGADHWWYGAHGGAGESILAALDDRGAAAEHRLPITGDPVVVCCRLTMPGLEAARLLSKAAAAGNLRAELVGLVTVAGSPKPVRGDLKDFYRIVRGGYRAWWTVPWIEDFGLTLDPTEVSLPKVVGTVIEQVQACSAQVATERNSS